MEATKILLVPFIVGLLSAGCNTCETLDKQICTDLGPEDCAFWMERGQTYAARAEGQPIRNTKELVGGSHAQTCQASLEREAYRAVLARARAEVTLLRQADGSQAAKAAGSQ